MLFVIFFLPARFHCPLYLQTVSVFLSVSYLNYFYCFYPYFVVLAVFSTFILLLISKDCGPLCSAPLTAIGTYSYSLSFSLANLFSSLTLHPSPVLLLLSTIIILIPFSFSSYRFFEYELPKVLAIFSWSKSILSYIVFFSFSSLPIVLSFFQINAYLGSNQIKDVDEISWTTPLF